MTLKLMTTAVPGLDAVLGGGLPEYSFNLICGAPGCGKTTLIHQLTFASATAERPAIYFTVVGEPPLKMLRYQQQMAFFDVDKVGTSVRFVDLGPDVLHGDLAVVLERIVSEVQASKPAVVAVDSFRSVLRATRGHGERRLEEQEFLHRLALHLTSWQVTSFLIGEYEEDEMRDNPVFTIADGIIRLSQQRERNSVVRKLNVVKVRGMASIPGLHTFRISQQGIQIFPRTTSTISDLQASRRRLDGTRSGFGIAALDEMIGGGLPVGDATLIAGPSGSGKTVLSTHFVAEGMRRGERSVLAIFEESPNDYLLRAQALGFDLPGMVESGHVTVIYLRPLDLSPDEILFQVQQAVQVTDAKRLVIDSRNGVELALAPTFRDDFRDSLYRLVGQLTSSGVGVVMTVEVTETYDEIKFSPHGISFMAQNILFLRYVELEGQIRRMVAVIKMRRSNHSHELREYEITDRGVQILGSFRDHEGVLSGTARPRAVEPDQTELAQAVISAIRALAASLLSRKGNKQP